MRVEVTNRELWDLLKGGYLNQESFRYHLTFKEFEAIVNALDDLELDLDLRDLLNAGQVNIYPAGVTVDDELIIFKNEDKTVTLE